MSERNGSTVTIVMPTYNRLDQLRVALDSARHQDYEPLEIIICDNASDDGTAEYCSSIAAQDPRVTVVRHSTNIGGGPNFVFGLGLAKSEFFMWLADDDWIDPALVRRCATSLEADPGAVLASGSTLYYEGDRLVMRSPPVELLHASPEERVAAFFWKVYDNGTFYGVYRREAMRRVRLGTGEFGDDWLFLAELAAGGRFVGCEDVALHRRLGGVSRDLKALALQTGVPKVLQDKPHLWTARNAFAQISSGSGYYASLTPQRRYLLATRAAGIITRRFCKPDWYLRLRARLAVS